MILRSERSNIGRNLKKPTQTTKTKIIAAHHKMAGVENDDENLIELKTIVKRTKIKKPTNFST